MKYIVFIISISSLFAQEKVTSRNKRIAFSLDVNPLRYSVSFDGKPIIKDAALDLDMAPKGTTLGGAEMWSKENTITYGEDRYRLLVGKASQVRIGYNQTVYELKYGRQDFKMDIEVRVFNAGVAFRYVFPKRGRVQITLHEENTQFNFASDPVVKYLPLPDHYSSHEGLYLTKKLSDVKDGVLMDTPALFMLPNQVYVAVTEAALLDYAGMYLVKHDGVMQAQLSAQPKVTDKVKHALPHRSPWRVLLISDRVGELLESNIITSLNEPCAIDDVTWIKPGTATFPWWNGTIVPAGVKGGNNFETNKYYIDFCAANRIKYHSVVEYGGHEWYVNDGKDYQPGPHADITKPVPGLDMKQVCSYANSNGVGIRVWTHWKALYPKLDAALALFQQWGVSGMMVDFMDRDDQEMVNIQTEILQKAAKHHLDVQFHGTHKPTGLSRTYPNEFTREGTLNYEVHKWAKTVTPEADLNVVFTRLLAGSVDYHLGGFRAVPAAKFEPHMSRPNVQGTRCHMLAMYIVMESALPMVCDYPEAYLGQPGFEVIQQIPTAWDRTDVPAAVVDQFAVVARKKDDKWFVGAINNMDERDLEIPTDFLDYGAKYVAELYTDADDALMDPNHLNKTSIDIKPGKPVKVTMAVGGGAVMIIQKKL